MELKVWDTLCTARDIRHKAKYLECQQTPVSRLHNPDRGNISRRVDLESIEGDLSMISDLNRIDSTYEIKVTYRDESTSWIKPWSSTDSLYVLAVMSGLRREMDYYAVELFEHSGQDIVFVYGCYGSVCN